MQSDTTHFLAKEYVALWKDHGVDMDPILKNAITRKTAGQSTQGTQREALGRRPCRSRPLRLEQIREWIGDCHRCRLCEARHHIVFGSGNPKARLLLVGEAPGADEDAQGLPFVGRAGQLLTKILDAIGIKREEVYIANVVKCRPPGNRAPEQDEIAQCAPFLKAQIEAISPRLIVALGLSSATTLIGKIATLSNLRGRFHPLASNPALSVMPTYHPAYLLRNPAAKKIVWEDMKLVKSKLEAT